jgi:hypothetical protein
MPKTVVPDLTPRLQSCGQGLRAAVAHVDAERELLRRAVVDALEEGMSWRAIAAAAGYSVGYVGKLAGTAGS